MDINGWDITKALKLLAKSNSVIFEWLQSPIIYINVDNFKEKLLDFAPLYHSPRAGLHHYIGITSNSYKSVKDNNQIKLKKYFYILRSLLSAIWIAEKNEIPPMEFHLLLPLIKDKPSLIKQIDLLLRKKANAMESDTVKPNNIIHNFVDEKLELCSDICKNIPKKSNDINQLDLFFRSMVKKYDN